MAGVLVCPHCAGYQASNLAQEPLICRHVGETILAPPDPVVKDMSLMLLACVPPDRRRLWPDLFAIGRAHNPIPTVRALFAGLCLYIVVGLPRTPPIVVAILVSGILLRGACEFAWSPVVLFLGV